MSPQIAWVALVTAGLLDVGWAIAMKYADGYTRLGVAYTVWTGIGAVGTLTMGVLLFGEALNPVKITGIVLVVAGIVVPNMATV
jgi:quaternary ammonium compound-resistance protein SugE